MRTLTASKDNIVFLRTLTASKNNIVLNTCDNIVLNTYIHIPYSTSIISNTSKLYKETRNIAVMFQGIVFLRTLTASKDNIVLNTCELVKISRNRQVYHHARNDCVSLTGTEGQTKLVLLHFKNSLPTLMTVQRDGLVLNPSNRHMREREKREKPHVQTIINTS